MMKRSSSAPYLVELDDEKRASCMMLPNAFGLGPLGQRLCPSQMSQAAWCGFCMRHWNYASSSPRRC
jgi:hypothetical protein